MCSRFMTAGTILFVFFSSMLLPPRADMSAPSATYLINGQFTVTQSTDLRDDIKVIEPLSDGVMKYTDLSSGFSLEYPAHMTPDTSLSAVVTVFYDDKTKIEVFYDNFEQSISNASEYIEYGNRFTQNTKDHSVSEDTMLIINNMPVHLLKWDRRKLSRIPDDKNHYVSAEFIKNRNEVYTVFIKSSSPITNEMDLLSSFRIVERQGTPRNYKLFQPSRTRLNTETRSFYDKYFSVTAPQRWGIFEPSAPEILQYLTPLENRVAYAFPFVLRYQTLEENLPQRGLQKAYDNHKFVELTLQTIQPGLVNALLRSELTYDNASIIYEILDGQYDEYLHNYAQQLKAFGHPVLFRLNNEMNGDWCWYSAFYTGKDAELYKALWQYIYETFEHHGVDNVLWVWNPHDVSRPEFKWNHHLMYYPGDEYVDLIGLTGYNTGTYFPGETWREFDEVYKPMYADYGDLFQKPFIITEFGSNSVGGDKPAWINRMFDGIKQFPNIKVAIWWSGIDYDQHGQPGRIYLLDESDETTEVFHKRLKEFAQ